MLLQKYNLGPLLASFLIAPALMHAQPAKREKPPATPSPLREAQKHPTLEVKAGYFFFGDCTMRKIYKDGGLDLQLSSSYLFKDYLQVYASVEFMQKSGRALNTHEKTRFWAVPLSLGLRPVFTIASFAQFYFTVGPRYVFAHVHNDSSFVDRNLSQNGIGGFANVGFNFFPMRHLLVDLFGEYSYVKLHFHPSKSNVYGKNTQVGGFVFGAGLGYVF